MDARIMAEAIEIKLSMPEEVEVITEVIVSDELVLALVSLFDPAVILAPLRNMGNSVTAVAPDYILIRGGKSALAYA